MISTYCILAEQVISITHALLLKLSVVNDGKRPAATSDGMVLLRTRVLLMTRHEINELQNRDKVSPRNEHIFITSKMPSALSCATLGGRKRENILWADGVSLIVRPNLTETSERGKCFHWNQWNTITHEVWSTGPRKWRNWAPDAPATPLKTVSLACCLPETFHSGTTNGELLLSRILTFLNASLVAPNSNTETWITQNTFP